MIVLKALISIHQYPNGKMMNDEKGNVSRKHLNHMNIVAIATSYNI